MLFKLLIHEVGVFDFAKIPSKGDFISIASSIFEVEKIVIIANPEDGQPCANLHIKKDSNRESDRKFTQDFRDRYEATLKKKVGLQNAKTLKSTFRGDSWRFELDAGGPQPEVFDISLSERVNRV